MAQTTLSVAINGPCLFLKAQFQTYAAFSYLLHNMIYWWHKPFNGETSASLTSNNQCSIVATAACFTPCNQRRTLALTYHATNNRKCCAPNKKRWTATIGPRTKVCRPLTQTECRKRNTFSSKLPQNEETCYADHQFSVEVAFGPGVFQYCKPWRGTTATYDETCRQLLPVMRKVVNTFTGCECNTTQRTRYAGHGLICWTYKSDAPWRRDSLRWHQMNSYYIFSKQRCIFTFTFCLCSTCLLKFTNKCYDSQWNCFLEYRCVSGIGLFLNRLAFVGNVCFR